MSLATEPVKFLGGWRIEQLEEGRLQIDLDGSPGYILINATDEGFIIDLWPDEGNESIGSTHALYTELEPA